MKELSETELVVLKILWEKSPIFARQISDYAKKSITCVDAALRKLISKGLVEMDGRRYSREIQHTYKPTDFSKKSIADYYAEQFHRLANFVPTSTLFASILGNNKDNEKLIMDLEEEIRKLKEE